MANPNETPTPSGAPLTEEQMEQVAGGLNPQPLPPVVSPDPIVHDHF